MRVYSLSYWLVIFVQPIAAECRRGRGGKLSRILGKNTKFNKHPVSYLIWKELSQAICHTYIWYKFETRHGYAAVVTWRTDIECVKGWQYVKGSVINIYIQPHLNIKISIEWLYPRLSKAWPVFSVVTSVTIVEAGDSEQQRKYEQEYLQVARNLKLWKLSFCTSC